MQFLISDNILSEGEAALALGYLMGDNCLYQAACEVPHTAKEYLGAAEMVFQAINLLPQYVFPNIHITTLSLSRNSNMDES